MKIDLLDIDAFVKGNRLSEIKTAQFFQNGSTPTSDGLFSTEIFGPIGSDKRGKTFAYIDLHGNFLHPVAYKALRRVFRNVDSLVSGDKFFSLNARGEIVEDEENGHTGIEWLYSVWDKVYFHANDSLKRDAYLKLFSLPKESLWIRTFLVSPATNRDFQVSGTVGKERVVSETSPVNDMYAKLIRMSINLDSGSIANYTRLQMQQLTIDLYDYFIAEIKGKEGIIQKGVMGKTIDYATRSVVTTPKIQSNRPEELQVPFGSIGIPLGQLTVQFYPFYVKWIREWADLYEEQLSIVGTGKNQHEIRNVLEQFDENHVKKILERFTESPEDRFKELTVTDDNGRVYPITVYKEDLGRNLTLTDLIYIATNDVIPGKHVFVTRYPVENINNITAGRIKVLSTLETVKEQKIGDKYLPDYPNIIPNYPIEETSTVFYDTVIPHTALTAAFGMDFDQRCA